MGDQRNKLSDFCRRITDAMEGVRSTNTMRAIGDQAADLIKTRTRLGYGVPPSENGTADRFDLPGLAQSTIDKRKRYAAELSDLTSPGRSNLTATGQMLDSVGPTNVTSGSVTVAPSGSRRRSKLSGGGASNAEVAGYVAEKGRPFMSLSQLELGQLWRYFRNTFGDLLRNNRIT